MQQHLCTINTPAGSGRLDCWSRSGWFRGLSVRQSRAVCRNSDAACVLRQRRHTALRSFASQQEACTEGFATASAAAAAGVPVLPPTSGPILVWFKADLRTRDHPGLLAAVARAAADGVSIIPFFCLDPDLYADLALTPQGPEALVVALSTLRQQLRSLGSDLVVRVGPAGFTTSTLATLAGCGALVTELEQDSRWLSVVADVSRQLRRQRTANSSSSSSSSSSLSASGPPPPLLTWSAPCWPSHRFQPNFRRWQAGRGNALPPLPPPQQLPPLPEGIDPGVLPPTDKVRQMLSGALTSGINQQRRCLTVLRSMLDEVAAQPIVAPLAQLLDLVQEQAAQQQQQQQPASSSSIQDSAAPSSSSSSVAPVDPMGVALAAYLAGGASDPRWAFLGPAIAAAEAPPSRGASFPALLGALFLLGALSPRQVHAAVLEQEGGRWLGLPPPFALSPAPVRAALAAVELADFHRQLAGPGAAPASPGALEPVASASCSWDEEEGGLLDWEGASWAPNTPRRCHWRWRGALTDYCVAEPALPREGAPAFLLVHGFGAFGDQWRGQFAALAAAGYAVYAPTLPGFGRSEKAALTYSQECWRDYLRDFVVRVVRRPVVLAGNSIGGFIAASLAADYPALVKGLVLLNSAGPIDAGFDPQAHAAAPPRQPPPAWVARTLTAGLMGYLEGSIAGQLRWLYPTNPAAADAWLEEEIFRAACDLGAEDVFGSVFYLPPPRALNYLVARCWRGPTLVLQGVLDPLNDAGGRARQLEALCPNVTLALLQAGHCPHDEVPEQVNEELLAFTEQFMPPPQLEEWGHAAEVEAQQEYSSSSSGSSSSGSSSSSSSGAGAAPEVASPLGA